MENLIIIAVIAAIICCAGIYIHKTKKRGVKCIGCPNGCCCNGCCCEHSDKPQAKGTHSLTTSHTS